MTLKIGVIFDKPQVEVNNTIEAKCGDKQKYATKKEICKVLKKRYDVVEIAADDKIINNLIESKIDLAFPLCTGIIGESRQSQVPAILEMLGIPYIGSGILAHSLALSKSMAKQIFDYNDISTPAFQIFNNINDRLDCRLNFPLIVKPSCEGSGFGIHRDSVVYNEQDLMEKVKKLLKEYRPPVLVEEFIEGRELTVGIIGNEDEKIFLPIMEINFDDIPKEFGEFYTFEVKSNFGEKTKYLCPVPINRETEQAIKDNAERAFDALGCKDFARIDIRLRENKPYILEINSLPGLKPQYSDLPKMALKAGLSYDKLIFKIVETAIKRIKNEKEYIVVDSLTDQIS
ncbi:D-alanine--D-alanine ligase family protein [Paramaledivibacter caminithermalis]|jgi:D-alanine-D-alanine ligase|uniref:D-alanine-D-alanine ligase n=1 Tax=Paramaledivibacter caminithermalis (strain DSM 15212 / CIP 107654 / DViRD3) TaxID=1121301 RepID=A0A1M6MRI0_PARC5|nr:ATP-grasp domain-containing protein [Paramaledivibacter caminithermalis]SHJ86067.1 D-alanine-D-alanine ligase [Paramaledivibacter caminithermalis DSM 15212]